MRYSSIILGGLMLAAAAPAMAQEATEPAPAFSVSGGVTAITDYRFRGLTQTDEKAALQTTLNVNHESGFYVGTWISTIDNKVSLPGYGGAEVDLYGGYATEINGIGLDAGVLYYYYPKGFGSTDFFEPYASVSYTVGPVTAKVGGNYAWGGQSGLGGDDSLYLYGNLGFAIPGTPVTASAHIGRSKGALGGFNLNPADDSYMDWSLGLEVSHDFVKLGAQYVDTDITSTAGYADAIGADPTFLAYLTLSF